MGEREDAEKERRSRAVVDRAKPVRFWRKVPTLKQLGRAGEAGRRGPHRSPNRTPRSCRRQVLRLRAQRRWGADHIAHEPGMTASTVQAILNQAGVGRLDRGDRAVTEPVRRYQRDRPGELVHVDVKKISGIPAGGGWRIHGRGQAPTVKRASAGGVWEVARHGADDGRPCG